MKLISSADSSCWSGSGRRKTGGDVNDALRICCVQTIDICTRFIFMDCAQRDNKRILYAVRLDDGRSIHAVHQPGIRIQKQIRGVQFESFTCIQFFQVVCVSSPETHIRPQYAHSRRMPDMGQAPPLARYTRMQVMAAGSSRALSSCAVSRPLLRASSRTEHFVLSASRAREQAALYPIRGHSAVTTPTERSTS